MADKRESINEEKAGWVNYKCLTCEYKEKITQKTSNYRKERTCSKCGGVSVDSFLWDLYEKPTKVIEEKKNSLTVTVEVDSDEAVKKLKSVQRELKKTISLFRELDKVSKVEINQYAGFVTGGIITKEKLEVMKQQEKIIPLSNLEDEMNYRPVRASEYASGAIKK